MSDFGAALCTLYLSRRCVYWLPSFDGIWIERTLAHKRPKRKIWGFGTTKGWDEFLGAVWWMRSVHWVSLDAEFLLSGRADLMPDRDKWALSIFPSDRREGWKLGHAISLCVCVLESRERVRTALRSNPFNASEIDYLLLSGVPLKLAPLIFYAWWIERRRVCINQPA